MVIVLEAVAYGRLESPVTGKRVEERGVPSAQHIHRRLQAKALQRLKAMLAEEEKKKGGKEAKKKS